MSEALAAGVGAIAGALATMGTQGWLAWLGRRNGSRTAARLLYGDIHEARDIMVAALEAGEWKTRRDMTHVVAAWRENREAIARAVKTAAFHDVAGAFKAVEFIQLIRERSAGAPDEGFHLAKPRMVDALPRCDIARLALAKASCSLWERYVTLRPGIVHERPISIPRDGPARG